MKFRPATNTISKVNGNHQQHKSFFLLFGQSRMRRSTSCWLWCKFLIVAICTFMTQRTGSKGVRKSKTFAFMCYDFTTKMSAPVYGCEYGGRTTRNNKVYVITILLTFRNILYIPYNSIIYIRHSKVHHHHIKKCYILINKNFSALLLISACNMVWHKGTWYNKVKISHLMEENE